MKGPTVVHSCLLRKEEVAQTHMVVYLLMESVWRGYLTIPLQTGSYMSTAVETPTSDVISLLTPAAASTSGCRLPSSSPLQRRPQDICHLTIKMSSETECFLTAMFLITTDNSYKRITLHCLYSNTALSFLLFELNYVYLYVNLLTLKDLLITKRLV